MREGSGAGAGCHRWYTRRAWAKREAEAVGGEDEDTDGDVGVARDAIVGAAREVGVDVGAVHGMDVDIGTARDAGWSPKATCGMSTVSEVPATEEG
jgi:hypothetical protein